MKKISFQSSSSKTNDTAHIDLHTLLFRLSETKKQILVQLALHPYLGYRRLSKRLGLSIGNIRSHLKRGKNSLHELGFVNPTVHGWLLTELGEKFVQKLQSEVKLFPIFGIISDLSVRLANEV